MIRTALKAVNDNKTLNTENIVSPTVYNEKQGLQLLEKQSYAWSVFERFRWKTRRTILEMVVRQ